MGVGLIVKGKACKVGFTPLQEKVIRALHGGCSLCREISSKTGISLGRVNYVLRGLRKWDYVDYNWKDPLYYRQIRRWFLTESFYKVHKNIL